MERWIRAAKCSWRGLAAAWRTEAAFREEVVVLVLAFPAALLLSADPWRRAALIGATLLVMIVELVNTAIEKLCDRATTEQDTQIGRVKDMGSAAVGLSILFAAALWSMALALALMGRR